MIRTLRTRSDCFSQNFNQILLRGKQDIQEVSQKVGKILGEIRSSGTNAIMEHIALFDSWKPQRFEEVKILESECKKAYEKLLAEEIKALNVAYERIYSFHQRQKQKTWIDIEANRSILGQKYTPIERVGLYIPGGKAAYPSSLLMNAIPALVAGVESIVVCTPAPSNLRPISFYWQPCIYVVLARFIRLVGQVRLDLWRMELKIFKRWIL